MEADRVIDEGAGQVAAGRERLVTGAGDIVGSAWRKASGRRRPGPRDGHARFRLDHMAEQAPSPASRVTLSDQRDALGMPRVRLDWRLGSLDMHSMARAQEIVREPTGDTSLSFGIGFSAGASETGAALRLGVEHAVTGRLSLELAGAFLDRGMRAESWTVYAGARLGLADEGDDFAPYLGLGAGVYRASFERVGYGMTDQAGAACMGPGRAEACYGSMPRFYAQRLRAEPSPARWPARRSFTDPMGTVGAGFRWSVTPQLALIPEARALLVFGEGESDAIGMFTVAIAYRF